VVPVVINKNIDIKFSAHFHADIPSKKRLYIPTGISVFEIDCVIIAIVTSIGATEPGCPLPLCVCKSKTTARCMNHEKDLDYIPQLPSSVKIILL
jgi:hypothetical protein